MLSSGSRYYNSPRTYTLDYPDKGSWPTLKRQELTLRCRVYLDGTGILTCFPFLPKELPRELGPAYPQLTNIAVEPLPLRRWGFSPHLCCYYYRDLHFYEVHLTSQPSFCPRRTPPYRITFRCPQVSVADLAPSIFGAPDLDR